MVLQSSARCNTSGIMSLNQRESRSDEVRQKLKQKYTSSVQSGKRARKNKENHGMPVGKLTLTN